MKTETFPIIATDSKGFDYLEEDIKFIEGEEMVLYFDFKIYDWELLPQYRKNSLKVATDRIREILTENRKPQIQGGGDSSGTYLMVYFQDFDYPENYFKLEEEFTKMFRETILSE